MQLSVDVGEHDLDTELTTILTSMYTVGIDPDIHPSLYNFRSQIIERVLKDDLVPMALNAAREEMLKKAQQSVMDICVDELWIELTTPPLQLKAIDDEVLILVADCVAQRSTYAFDSSKLFTARLFCMCRVS